MMAGRGREGGCGPAGPDRAPSLSQGLCDLSGDGGVRKRELRPGTGELMPPSALVAVRYSGYLEHRDAPFCTNWYNRSHGLMKLGEDITLGGLEVGLLTMKKGEVARFYFSPKYAYGRQGCLPLIPPNTSVVFDVEVLDFIDSDESDVFFELTAEQQDTFPLQKVLKVAAIERKVGNYLYLKQDFESAKDRYRRVFNISKDGESTTSPGREILLYSQTGMRLPLFQRSSSEAEQCQINASKLLLLLNLALTYLKLERPARALTYGEKALEIDQRNAKALFRCGQACLCMTDYKKARDFLVRAQRVEPFNHEINNELKKLASCYKNYMEKEKEMCCRMFAALSSSD